MNAVLKYPGAKNRLAPWICSYIPEHKVYLEPFAGSLGVLFNKERSHIETVNDLNGEVVNFFRVLRDQGNQLRELISVTPYAREEYELAYKPADSDLERARRFCIRCWMGFGAANRYQNGFRSGQQSNSPNPARAWRKLPDTLNEAAERLKGVQIEHLPALELTNRYDTEDVFIYADPPYLPNIRKNCLYACEMSYADHEALLDALKKHPGKVMISGYENELYDSELAEWRKVQKSTTSNSGSKRVETLWMNYSEEKQLKLKL